MSAFLDNEELLGLRLNFIHSAKEKLGQIEVLILKAESQKNQEASKTILKDILGLSHSIKGSSRVYKFDALALICHKLEDYITELLNHDKIVSAEELTKMLKHVDLLANYCDEFAAHKAVNDADFQDRYRLLFAANNTQDEASKTDATKRLSLSNAKVQILIVGINKTILKQIYMALVDINHNISFAVDPFEAFHRLSLEKFDLIISSFVMDPIDGMSFSLAVKNQWQEKAPKIILLSTEPVVMKYDQALLPDKIFIKSLSLPQEMKEYFEKEYSVFAKAKAPVAKKIKYRVKTIFFVEDDANILDLFLMVFTEKKNVVLFNEVTKADPFAKITQMRPDLIICDIHVPNVDTTKLLLKIKTSEEISKTPVVFFTGDPDQPIAAELRKMGALAILDKTIILTSMFEELEKLGIEINSNA